MSAKPDLVMPLPMLPETMASLDKEFTVHRLWQAPDRDALIAKIAPTTRFAAVGSHAAIDAAFLDAMPNIEIASNFGVGYDNVDAKLCATRNVVVTNTPDVLNEEVADTALGLLLMTVRELPQAEKYLRAGKWMDKPYPLTQGTLRGRTMGIVGLGRIGKAIARRAEAFGVKIAYFGRTKQADVAYPFYNDLEALARDVDILMLILPGGAATAKIVNAQVLKALGPDGILINVARGTVVDEPALVEALRNRTILGAGLDVFAEEPKLPEGILELDNAVLLPHVGSASKACRIAMGQVVVDNLTSWRDGKGALTPVAETPWPKA